MEITGKWIQDWASEYKQQDKEKILEKKIFSAIGKRNLPEEGLTLEILKDIAHWKAKGRTDWCVEKDSEYVREITTLAFSTKNERLRIEILTLLKGVNIRTASAILMFCFPEKCTTMDFRAWESLVDAKFLTGKIKDDYEHYRDYNEICNQIAKDSEVAKDNEAPLRTLDKALWQWNKENGKKT
jgi:hypothetical protein